MTPRRIVLDDDGLDLLELALGGALPSPPLPQGIEPGGDGVALTDAENTPLARLSAAAIGGGTHLETLRPFARHGGPQWDPDLRLSPSEARARAGMRRSSTARFSFVHNELGGRIAIPLASKSGGDSAADTRSIESMRPLPMPRVGALMTRRRLTSSCGLRSSLR